MTSVEKIGCLEVVIMVIQVIYQVIAPFNSMFYMPSLNHVVNFTVLYLKKLVALIRTW